MQKESSEILAIVIPITLNRTRNDQLGLDRMPELAGGLQEMPFDNK